MNHNEFLLDSDFILPVRAFIRKINERNYEKKDSDSPQKADSPQKGMKP
tara:strand:+ start:106 stop:252 length:147 start_codon:yes stop_codon:yes gene_type:complete